jgi:hypothetical protein
VFHTSGTPKRGFRFRVLRAGVCLAEIESASWIFSFQRKQVASDMVLDLCLHRYRIQIDPWLSALDFIH